MNEAIKILEQKSSLLHDKTGWGISIRILRLMAYYSKNRMDKYAEELRLLKKFITYHTSEEKIHPRLLLICRTLFHLGAVCPRIKKLKENYNLLCATKGFFAWNTMKPEIIAFHPWLKKRTAKPADLLASIK